MKVITAEFLSWEIVKHNPDMEIGDMVETLVFMANARKRKHRTMNETMARKYINAAIDQKNYWRKK